MPEYRRINLLSDYIEHEFSPSTQVLQDWIPTLNPDGFDSATTRVDFRGTESEIVASAEYAKGAVVPGHPSLFCIGILSIEESRFGRTIAIIGARGFWDGPPDVVRSFSTSMTERQFPFAMDSSGLNIYALSGVRASPPKTPLNPLNGNKPWRIRQIAENASILRSGVDIGFAGVPFTPPAKPTDPRPPFLLPVLTGLTDPLLTTKSGWVRASYSDRKTVIGQVVLREWTDEHLWIDPQSE